VTSDDGARTGPRLDWHVIVCQDGLDRWPELEEAFRDGGFSVSVVRDARRLVARVKAAGRVIVVVSDGVEGWLRLVGDLHRAGPTLRVFLITDLDDRLELVAALSAGVDGIGRPGDPPAAMLRSISSLCEDGVSIPRALIKDLVGEVRVGRGHRVRSASGTVRVTDREWQILQLMLQGRTTKEMAAELYVSVGTVRSHVSALLGKLGVRSRHEAVALVDRR
jgi:DNA-binding NarL/FixJ family response regulator